MNLFNYILVFLALNLGSCSTTDEVTQEEPQQTLPETIERNVSYGESNQQAYDMYLPSGRNDRDTKTIVIIHGGSWISGDKADLKGYVSLMQSAFPEHAIINMNYRLANGSFIPAFPNQINDVDAVLQQLKDRKQELQINGEFALMGLSAGAHLATLYDYKYDDDDQVKAVVNIVGPVDFTDPFYTSNSGFQFLLSNLIDASEFPAGIDPAVAVSPALQVNENSSPTINFYGNRDTLVALSQLTSLENALTENNIPFESTIYDGGHGNWSQEQYADLQIKVKAFIEQYL
ncbi:Acetyl esterase/lipase [Nonlabens sp. Hel1_33_55]|uniref:alpha/beta hydrolase n=1 Tax=Nonlabens sp. Hel1_33_55 TaxID=1336802 RepID=UPI000875E06E|nr:alpha/beta hydrolase [Nonlabens sp. Hel1_33_55]SCY39060.1 Acetyl esterase/lipase [Nonlabens sp. Hel1_33_55]